MKKTLLFAILLMFITIDSLKAQQNYSEIIENCVPVVDNKSFYPDQVVQGMLEDGSDAEITTWDIKKIYDLDVIALYQIKGYNTELQRELYKETDEYKKYEAELKKLRDTYKSTTFLYIHKLKSNYNIEKSGFAYEIELYEGRYKEFPGYINHGTFCIEYATKRFPKNNIEVIKRWGGSDYFYLQRVYLPVKDKQTALRIEQAGNDKGVLFLFQIDSIRTEKTLFFDSAFALTKTIGIYIINTRTGEIYCKVL